MSEVEKSSGRRTGHLLHEYCRMHRFREYHLGQIVMYLEDIKKNTELTSHLKVCRIVFALREQQADLNESDLVLSVTN